jgi:acetolactate synthase-1/2/3 large subunit
MNGADALCDTLLAGGVDTCFANPGTSEIHLVAALDRRPQIRCVLGLFEGVATGAADGYGRMTGKPAATLLHLGPGLANGLANLHNARRARTPIVNIVGDHATSHLPYDAPLTSDVEAIARPMSYWVRTTEHADNVSIDTAAAICEARAAPGQIVTLIVRADASWSETRAPLQTVPGPSARPSVPDDAIRKAARKIRDARAPLLMLSGVALQEDALAIAGRIAKAAGVRLLAQQSNARIARGAGRVPIERVPYATNEAVKVLADVDQLILVGAKPPVGFFAYPGAPSVMTPPSCSIMPLASPADDLLGALQSLAEELGVGREVKPDVAPLARPGLPIGALTADAVALAVAALMPENAILCDESISSGRRFFQTISGAPPHDYLHLTGGAIGLGLPMAAGAAIACPDRKVIALQADGSGMFTVQALWTHARENLDIVTIIFANRTYAVLRGELRQVHAGDPAENARRMLDIDGPALDWTRLAGGMGVEAARVSTAEEFTKALGSALARRGPYLIEAVI